MSERARVGTEPRAAKVSNEGPPPPAFLKDVLQDLATKVPPPVNPLLQQEPGELKRRGDRTQCNRHGKLGVHALPRNLERHIAVTDEECKSTCYCRASVAKPCLGISSCKRGARAKGSGKSHRQGKEQGNEQGQGAF